MTNITRVKLRINQEDITEEIIIIKIELNKTVADFIKSIAKEWVKDCACPACQNGKWEHFWASLVMQSISELPAPRNEEEFKGNTHISSKLKH